MEAQRQLPLIECENISNSIYFDSGRSALLHLLRVLNVNHILVPCFRCNVIDNVLDMAGIKQVSEYDGFLINSLNYSANCILIVNYFGVTYTLDTIVKLAKSTPSVTYIFDDVHLYRSAIPIELPENLFLILGYRKILFAPYGAVLIGRLNRIVQNCHFDLQPTDSLWLDKNMGVREPVSLRTLKWFSVEQCAGLLEERISKLNSITGNNYRLENGCLISYYPIVDFKEQLRGNLFRDGIESYYYWKNYSTGFVQLPIHQNLSPETFEFTWKKLKDYV